MVGLMQISGAVYTHRAQMTASTDKGTDTVDYYVSRVTHALLNSWPSAAGVATAASAGEGGYYAGSGVCSPDTVVASVSD